MLELSKSREGSRNLSGSAVTSSNSRSLLEAVVFRVFDRGFIGETEVRLQLIFG
jgi:hypothetical protein